MKFLIIAGIALVLLLTVWHTEVIYFDVPPRYMGWVSVKFEDPSCASSGWFLKRIQVTPNGTGCAQFRYPDGWHADIVVYGNPDGSAKRLPLTVGAPNTPIGLGPVSKVFVFFVGTEAELSRSWHSEPQIP